ncbi:MAG: hypothetical protein DI530_00305 [Sphingomonas sp.]|uniref:Uncharacterized protein n=1 Tax=Sphingomonas adhaesiva TaxID=28212 RepID=A0A2A4I7C6_9SPHN|nr:hypothetical protein COA07_12095 [Sphingomonas adhaesiva]PZU82069.1 MAG: hypothetical protein DI530_00305 [Sphingomonas sp.]
MTTVNVAPVNRPTVVIDLTVTTPSQARNDAAIAIQHTAGDIAREPPTRAGTVDELLARPGALDRFAG